MLIILTCSVIVALLYARGGAGRAIITAVAGVRGLWRWPVTHGQVGVGRMSVLSLPRLTHALSNPRCTPRAALVIAALCPPAPRRPPPRRGLGSLDKAGCPSVLCARGGVGRASLRQCASLPGSISLLTCSNVNAGDY